jgi:hypothetical protein
MDPYKIIFIKCFNVTFINTNYSDKYKYNIMKKIFFDDHYIIEDAVQKNWIKNIQNKLFEHNINLDELIHLQL